MKSLTTHLPLFLRSRKIQLSAIIYPKEVNNIQTMYLIEEKLKLSPRILVVFPHISQPHF